MNCTTMRVAISASMTTSSEKKLLDDGNRAEHEQRHVRKAARSGAAGANGSKK